MTEELKLEEDDGTSKASRDEYICNCHAFQIQNPKHMHVTIQQCLRHTIKVRQLSVIRISLPGKA